MIQSPPFCTESELGVLSALMIDGKTYDTISDELTAEMFYVYRHRVIYLAIEYLSNSNKPFDAITVLDCLERSSSKEDVTLEYLADLLTGRYNSGNYQAYADIIRDKYMLRQLSVANNEISDAVYSNDGKTVSEIVSIAESKIMAVGEGVAKSKTGPKPMALVSTQAMEAAEERRNNPRSLLGESWGFTGLDRLTSGLHASDLIIIAGRPSMGKTSFAMNVAATVAIKSKDPKPTAIFSMEMPGDQLANRMLASIGGINLNSVRNGQMTDGEWARLSNANRRIAAGLMHVDDTPALTPGEVRGRCRRLHRETGGLGLVVIDYLQLMQTERRDNRNAEISEISRSLKALAKELQVPVIALSQLNRSLESRPDKRPLMSDLRESGAIEQDADVIAFIYRDEVYDPASSWKGSAEILIRKQRNGPTGMERVSFNGAHTLFDNYIDDRYDEMQRTG